MLKPQDVLILLKLIAMGKPFETYDRLAETLHMSSSEVHKGLQRAAKARLFSEPHRKPIKAHLVDFLICGVPYAFAVEPGPVSRGMPTSFAASPLAEQIATPPIGGTDASRPVWPTPTGDAKGYSIEPLYKTAPLAAQSDQRLYELLALTDALREGRARERELAATLLKERMR